MRTTNEHLDEDGRMDPGDDPRLTALALGELACDEREEMQAQVDGDAALTREVSQLQELAQALTLEFASADGETPHGLDAARREALQGKAAKRTAGGDDGTHSAVPTDRRRDGLRLVKKVTVGLAASLLTVAGSLLWIRHSIPPENSSPFSYSLGFGASSQRSAARPTAVRPARAEHQSQEMLRMLEALGYSGGDDHGDMNGLGYSDESYVLPAENPFFAVANEPLSTFSIDVDTASYANVRRILDEGRLPPPDAVRIEELINYFPYDDAPPLGPEPFATHLEVAGCPWTPEHRLVRIGLKGAELNGLERRAKNLVFLIDVSGSMQSENKLPLLVRSMHLLVEQLSADDRVALVVYAGASGLALPSTSCGNRDAILSALDGLSAGGSTNGGAGIELAYRVAQENFLEGGINRVVLATDGDFNVGISDNGSLVRLIEEKAKGGVFLSVLGFGSGNLKDAKMEQLANHGNGNYAYVDSLQEARKVLVREIGGTLQTIAKDVKIQVEFNPARVSGFRLIGYENRVLEHADFNDDQKDAGEIGAGHSVTALFEIVPAGTAVPQHGVDSLKYQTSPTPTSVAEHSDELLTVKLRYKQPSGSRSVLSEVPLLVPANGDTSFAGASGDLRWAASVAAFGMCLRDSEHRGNADLESVYGWAFDAAGPDPFGYRLEFLRLVTVAERLSR